MGASWQAFYAHLCAASIIRAMPETEIPPAMRGDLYSLFERGFCCKHPHLRHTPPDHTCRHSRPRDCLTPFFSRFRGRFLLRLSFFISFLHNESGDVRSSISPDRCYLLLHGNMLARSALFQVEKRCAAYSCRRKPEQ